MPTVTLTPSSVSEDTSVGVNTTSWSNLNNVLANDANDAGNSIAASSAEVTYYIKIAGTNPVPAPASGYETIIDGVTFWIRAFSDDSGPGSGTAKTYSTKLVSAGTLVGTDLGEAGALTIAKDTDDDIYSLGGVSETWGCTQEELLALDGVAVAFYDTGTKPAQIYVNYIELSITYHEELVTIDDGIYTEQLKKRRASFMQFLEDD